MVLKLSYLLAPIQRFHPEIVSEFIADYCSCADQSGDETYHYGYGSLKWALSFIAEQDTKNVGLIFFNIICEGKAKNIDQNTYEYGILKFRSITRFRMDLKAIDPVNLDRLPIMVIGKTKIVINATGRQLSAMIFRNIPGVGLIVSACKGTYSSIKMRAGRDAINRVSTDMILDLLGSVHGGWAVLSNGSGTTIINHEITDITADEIIEIITPALL